MELPVDAAVSLYVEEGARARAMHGRLLTGTVTGGGDGKNGMVAGSRRRGCIGRSWMKINAEPKILLS